MRSNEPVVTVLMPAKNEEADIGASLEALAGQDFDRPFEIIVIDGASTDDTALVAEATALPANAELVVVNNSVGSTPSSLNLGLSHTRAPIVCRVDARSIVAPNYLSTCAEVLENRPDVAVTGGSQLAVSRPNGGVVETAIERALNNRFAMGFARYRRGAQSGPADTVYLGAFRTEELREAGGWAEALTTNQDFELNQRMGRGGLVWFDDRLVVEYRPRASFRGIIAQYQRFGMWKGASWRHGWSRPSPRHYLLVCAPVLGIAGFALLVRRSIIGATFASVATLAAVDRGSTGQATLLVRGLAVTCNGAIGAAWWTGVVKSLVFEAPDPTSRGRDVR